MKNERDFVEEKFNYFLVWLHPDRDQAGERYVVICNGLAHYFARRACHQDFNCPHAEELTQETIDRVIVKIDENRERYPREPERCIYGYAKNVRREHLREKPLEPLEPDLVDRADDRHEDASAKEKELNCLERCLEQHTENNQRIVTEYFSYSGQKRIERRRQLAIEQKTTAGNLAVKALRLRKGMHECLGNCLGKIFRQEV